ncbi:MAG: hypothetical protein M1837_002764 [Sclerophora amabilis]|nr:MAG: hypothetical protein M1837_002764 [Sclerophora amabilis]
MTTTKEGWHTVEDGTKLYTKTWSVRFPSVLSEQVKLTGLQPANIIRARLVFVHGFSDHCNAYYNLFPTLSSRGIQVLAYDQRGWGRSVARSSERGLTGPTSLVLSDLTSFLKSCLHATTTADTVLTPPLFLMGHSMGGAEILMYAFTGPSSITSHITGYLSEAPHIALHPSLTPTRGTNFAGKLAAKLLPNTQLVRKLDEKLLSRDVDVQRAFVEDELCHDTGTLEGLSGLMDRAAALQGGKVRLSQAANERRELRIWVGHGTADRITDPEVSRRWVEGLGEQVADKEFKAYDGWYHKLHAEPGEAKQIFANDVADWILARVPSEAGEEERSQEGNPSSGLRLSNVKEKRDSAGSKSKL